MSRSAEEPRILCGINSDARRRASRAALETGQANSNCRTCIHGFCAASSAVGRTVLPIGRSALVPGTVWSVCWCRASIRRSTGTPAYLGLAAVAAAIGNEHPPHERGPAIPVRPAAMPTCTGAGCRERDVATGLLERGLRANRSEPVGSLSLALLAAAVPAVVGRAEPNLPLGGEVARDGDT